MELGLDLGLPVPANLYDLFGMYLLCGTRLPEHMHSDPQHGYYFGVWCRVRSSIEQASMLYSPSLKTSFTKVNELN